MAAGSPANTVRRMRVFNLILTLIGIGLSGAALFVEFKKAEDKNYVAFCDINDNITCSSVFSSKYGKGFGVLGEYLGKESPLVQPNAVYGVIFYSLILVLGLIPSYWAAVTTKFIALPSNLMSAYLAYISFFVLKVICPICLGVYLTNFLITVCSVIMVNNLEGQPKNNKKNQSSNNKKNKKKKN